MSSLSSSSGLACFGFSSLSRSAFSFGETYFGARILMLSLFGIWSRYFFLELRTFFALSFVISYTLLETVESLKLNIISVENNFEILIFSYPFNTNRLYEKNVLNATEIEFISLFCLQRLIFKKASFLGNPLHFLSFDNNTTLILSWYNLHFFEIILQK